MFQKVLALTSRHKMLRGMLSYGILWPLGCLVEQTFTENRSFRNYDWMKCLRYSLFGSMIMAPSMFLWVRIADIMWTKSDFRSSLAKSLTEQVALDPFGIAFFLFTMSRLEGKTPKQAVQEVRAKYFEIFRVGVFYWPIVQTANFMFVRVANQVVVTSIFSLIWSTFLAYIKSSDLTSEEDNSQSYSFIEL